MVKPVKLLVQHSNICMDRHTDDQSVGLDRMTKMTVLGTPVPYTEQVPETTTLREKI